MEIASCCAVITLSTQQLIDPGILVDGMSGIGGIAKDHHGGFLPLDFIGTGGFTGNGMGQEHTLRLSMAPFQGVGEKHVQALARLQLQPLVFVPQLQGQLQVANGIGRHQQFKAEQPR